MTGPDEVTGESETEAEPGSRIGLPRAVAADGSGATTADDSTPGSATGGASAPILLDAVFQERQLRFSALDAVEMKAGVTLGFAGTLIALTTAFGPTWSRWIVVIPAVQINLT